MADFVNPYTFVPFPEVDSRTFRRKPAGHAAMGGAADGSPRLLGQVEVTVTARSPLLVRDSEKRFPRRRFSGSDSAVPYLPGSALAGVVRSLHESLAGGCLRVFDGELLPSYRDIAQMRPEGWTLALVTAVQGERPSELALCDEVIRVRADALARVLGGPRNVVTGSRVEVTGQPRDTGRGLAVVTEPHDLAPGGGWVVLVTDANARHTKRPYYCAVGKLPKAGIGWDDGWSPAWDDLLHRIDDTDDMRQARGANDPARPLRPTSGPVTAEVRFNDALVGVRHEARRAFFAGQVLWVKRSGGGSGVDEFALSAIWRHRGQGPAGDRVPEVLLACGDPDSLCPTCRVFGSADTGGAEDAQARQRAYRGHLRFSDARPVGPVGPVGPVAPLERHQLAPLGRARPGSGQFYLDNDPRRYSATPQHDRAPLREWGSAADRPAWRALRGRKHYWLAGDDHAQRPLFRVTEGTFDGEMAGEGEAVPAGTRFTFTVHFENLDTAELGALLAALDPSAVLGAHAPDGAEIGFAVGGGRPFGFGTCTAEVTSVRAHTAASWYRDAPPPPVAAPDAVAAFTGAVDPGVRATWPALAAALHLDHVDQADVWYPTGKEVPEGNLRTTDLDAGFDFWKNSQGTAFRDRTYPLVPLPEVTAADQHLPVSPAPTITGDQRPARGRRGSTPGRRR